MSKILIVKTKPVLFEALSGASIGESIETVLAFCKLYQTEAVLEFNGKSHTITPSTDPVALIWGWYK